MTEGSGVGPRVDVVIALFRPGSWIEACLESVAAQHGVQPHLILVDDDPGEPLAARLAAAYGGDAEAIETRRNRGFAAATNSGISAGRSPLVLCLNQDARLAHDYLERLVARFKSDDHLAAVSGKLLHVAAPGDPPDGLIDSAGIGFRRGRRGTDIGQGAVDDGRFDGWREVFGVSAAAALYRRDALQRVARGGRVFDERFVMYKEDVDLAWRLRRAGYAAGVDGTAIALHGRGVGRPPRVSAPLAFLRRLWIQERGKGSRARRLAWRNQMLMQIENESVASLGQALPWLFAVQAAHAAFDLALDPIGGLTNRARMLVEAVDHMRSRDPRFRGADLGEWLR